jgi:hypothetical protein
MSSDVCLTIYFDNPGMMKYCISAPLLRTPDTHWYIHMVIRTRIWPGLVDDVVVEAGVFGVLSQQV